MRTYIRTLPFIVSLLPALVHAAEAPAVPPSGVPPLRYEATLSRIDQKVAKLFGEDKQQSLRRIAEAAVLADYCAAINLDQDRFRKEFDALAAAKGSPAERSDYNHKLSMYFGVYVGLLVAEGTERRAEFCGVAEDALKNAKPISRFWIATTDQPPPALQK